MEAESLEWEMTQQLGNFQGSDPMLGQILGGFARLNADPLCGFHPTAKSKRAAYYATCAKADNAKRMNGHDGKELCRGGDLQSRR